LRLKERLAAALRPGEVEVWVALPPRTGDEGDGDDGGGGIPGRGAKKSASSLAALAAKAKASSKVLRGSLGDGKPPFDAAAPRSGLTKPTLMLKKPSTADGTGWAQLRVLARRPAAKHIAAVTMKYKERKAIRDHAESFVEDGHADGPQSPPHGGLSSGASGGGAGDGSGEGAERAVGAAQLSAQGGGGAGSGARARKSAPVRAKSPPRPGTALRAPSQEPPEARQGNEGVVMI